MFTNLLHFYLKFLLDRQGVLVCLLLCFVKLQFLLFLFALCYFNIQWHWQRQKILLLVRLTSLLCCLLLSSLNSSFTTTFHLTTTLIHMSKGVCLCICILLRFRAARLCLCDYNIYLLTPPSSLPTLAHFHPFSHSLSFALTQLTCLIAMTCSVALAHCSRVLSCSLALVTRAGTGLLLEPP